MVEKTYHLAPYVDPFYAYLMHQLPKCVSIYQSDNCNVAVNSQYTQLVKKNCVGQKLPQKTIWIKNLP